jgi:methylmalonyl-CoA mutase N-terminal domain/subunit
MPVAFKKKLYIDTGGRSLQSVDPDNNKVRSAVDAYDDVMVEYSKGNPPSCSSNS